MNEFIAKKLGEVVAFSRIGLELEERGGAAFDEALSSDTAEYKAQLVAWESAALEMGNEVTTAKAEKTTEKLRKMMELYIGDEWDNSVELLEWMSFFYGSASAHWSLVSGASEAAGLSDLHAMAGEAQEGYHQYLHHTIAALREVGVARATA